MYTLAGLLDSINAFGNTRMREIIQEFERWTKAELDYLAEARHAATIAANAADDPNEVDPKIYLEYTRKRVLTMEFIDGIPMIDIIYALRDGNAEFLRGLADRGLSLPLLARALCWNSLNQIYQFGYFHADLHPANLLALPGNAIGYVDFGIVGRMSSELRISLAVFANSLFDGELSSAVDELTLWIRPSSATDSRIARADLERIMEKYLVQLEDTKLASRGFSTLEFGVLNVIRKHRMALDSNVALYFKAVTALDTVIYQLFPEFDLRSLESEFFRSFKTMELSRLLRLENLEDSVVSLHLNFGRTLRGLERLARRELASDGRGTTTWSGPRRERNYITLSVVVLFSVAIGVYLGRSADIARLRSLSVQPSVWPIVAGVLVVLVVVSRLRRSKRRKGQGVG
jgi:ubiquinone biosynthesis protein